MTIGSTIAVSILIRMLMGIGLMNFILETKSVSTTIILYMISAILGPIMILFFAVIRLLVNKEDND